MKTRYILYPLLMLLAILLPTSCSFEEDMLDVPTSDSEKVHLKIDLTLAGTTNAESRAFGDNVTTFNFLHVALFEKISDGNYYLKGGIRQATKDNTTGAWSVEIPTTGNDCHLHFIANYEGLTGSFNEEGQLIGLLETNGDNHDVYWNYVSLNGIGGNNQTELSLTVPLLRNYVQVKIDTNSDFGSLTDVQYLLYNVPTKGTVAAYGTSVVGKFPHFEKFNDDGSYKKDNGQYVLKSYTELTGEGYAGNEPYDDGTLIGKNTSDYLNNNDNWKSIETPLYMYERSNRQASASTKTCMLIRGKYNRASDYTYYKLDFVYYDEDTKAKVYYNLLRNFIYTMRINEVNGEGYASAADALSQPACNNISGDAVAANYTNISNGSKQLLVSSTYMMFTNTNEAYLYFKYIPSVSNPNETANNTENVTISLAPLQQGQSSSPVSSYVVDWNGGEGQYAGWGKITFTPNTPGDIAVTREMTISAGATYEGTGANKVMVDAGLQRTITLSLRKPYYDGATTSWVTAIKQQVGNPKKTEVVITMSLPDNIPPRLFPLRMFISSAANTLYATGIPIEVRNGEYGFIKEISLSEYQNRATTPITQTLLPNCTDYGTTIYVKNEYFATGSVTISH